MLLIAEFVVDLLYTGRMLDAEYREFIIDTLESLSAGSRCANWRRRAGAPNGA
jgi:hypothetical protein